MFGVAELFAAIVPGARSLVIAVGDEVIDRTPGWLERAVIQNLGTSDKPFLIANILVVSALLGALLGILAARRFVVGAAGIALMAAVGTAASFRDPQTDGLAPLWVGLAGAAAGIGDALASAAGGSGGLGTAWSCSRAAEVDPPTLSRSRLRRRARRGAGGAFRRPAARRKAAASTRSARRSACRDPSAGRRRLHRVTRVFRFPG